MLSRRFFLDHLGTGAAISPSGSGTHKIWPPSALRRTCASETSSTGQVSGALNGSWTSKVQEESSRCQVYLTWWKNLGKKTRNRRNSLEVLNWDVKAHWRHELEIKWWLPPTDFKNLHQKKRNVVECPHTFRQKGGNNCVKRFQSLKFRSWKANIALQNHTLPWDIIQKPCWNHLHGYLTNMCVSSLGSIGIVITLHWYHTSFLVFVPEVHYWVYHLWTPWESHGLNHLFCEMATRRIPFWDKAKTSY